jgi:hypothetical protein
MLRAALTIKGSGVGSIKHTLSLPDGSVQPCPVQGRKTTTAMNGRRKKEKVTRKRGQLPTYDPLDFSRFTASENTAGAFFQQTHEMRAVKPF